jgi:hypothetical protein
VQRLARLGYLAKGIVYLLVGGIALQAAFGSSQPTGSRGALGTLPDEPWGRALLAIIAVGLFGYSLWRIYGAAADPEHDGTGHRFYSAGVAVVHIGLALAATRLALSGTGGGDDGTQRWTATALGQPLGRWLVVGAASAIVGWGIAQLVRAWKAKLDDQLDLGRLSSGTRTWVRRTARFGIAARGVVFLLVGVFLAIAGFRHDSSEARDAGQAMSALEQQPFGSALLAVVALGLIAYAVYEFIRARYRVIRVGGGGGGVRLERV